VRLFLSFLITLGDRKVTKFILLIIVHPVTQSLALSEIIA